MTAHDYGEWWAGWAAGSVTASRLLTREIRAELMRLAGQPDAYHQGYADALQDELDHGFSLVEEEEASDA